MWFALFNVVCARASINELKTICRWPPNGREWENNGENERKANFARERNFHLNFFFRQVVCEWTRTYSAPHSLRFGRRRIRPSSVLVESFQWLVRCGRSSCGSFSLSPYFGICCFCFVSKCDAWPLVTYRVIILHQFSFLWNRRTGENVQINFTKIFLLIAKYWRSCCCCCCSLFPFHDCLISICRLSAVVVHSFCYFHFCIFVDIFCICFGRNCLEWERFEPNT